MRMPADMNRLDPSTERKSRQNCWVFCRDDPAHLHRTRSRNSVRGLSPRKDAGRELWLSMDDLTRHVLMFATTGAGKTETTTRLGTERALLGRRSRSSSELSAPYIMVTNGGDFLTVYEVAGSYRETDEAKGPDNVDSWQGRLDRMTETLTALYRHHGHKISTIHECDPDGGRLK
ncbi:hypothetical protein [Erwinia amylovora]|uniref:hypothetical protein n=1 Tax=Erwinia amylovora TaxID=552 RepID=UPI001C556B99|nr:hypothetical protein [Erwinia amylovora]